jgi:hypothetical protein
MFKRGWVLALALLPAVAFGGEEPSTTPQAPAPASPAAEPHQMPAERFTLFPQALAPRPTVDLSGPIEEKEKRLFHQSGDPDSLFTLGQATPGGEVHVKAAIELNEMFLKAVPPDASVSPNDTRPRAAGSILPMDRSGRPYQLRLGARLVW